MKNIKKVLIYRIGNLGDTVCAMPALVAIRQRFPEAWVGLLTNKEMTGNPDPEEILKLSDIFDEIITYKPGRIHELGYLWNLTKKLRALRIDLLVYLSISKSTYHRLFRDWFFFRVAGCRSLIGFKFPRPIRYDRSTGISVPVFLQEVDRLMSLLTPLGVNPAIIDFRLPIKENDKQTINSIWNHYQFKDKKPIVAICPGGKFPSKLWPVNRFIEVISILREQFDAQILLIGGSGEKKLSGEIIEKVGHSVVNLIEKTNYMESAEAISRCHLLISNDCGAAHLSAAVGTPVVGIYSSRDYPGAWHPWGNIHTILRNDSLSCRFCFKTECETMQCLNSITVEQVIETCGKYLRKNAGCHY